MCLCVQRKTAAVSALLFWTPVPIYEDEALIVQPDLKFIQLLCEGHNATLQVKWGARD